MSNILRNALRFADGTVIESHHRHDFICYDGLCVDGGLSYLRRVGDILRDVEDISLTTDSPFEEIREGFSWGTRGRDGEQPLKYVPLKDLETDHIQAILETQWQVLEYIREVFYKELEIRGVESLYYIRESEQRKTGSESESERKHQQILEAVSKYKGQHDNNSN